MKRADELIFALGLAPSRAKARALIEEGKVFCAGKPIDKPSRKFPPDASFDVLADSMSLRFVSRAGLKLEAYLEEFCIDLCGARVLDAGASTGGFTDCALSRGAVSSVCVDVGSGQLAHKLREDLRVINMEKTDVRSLSPETFNGELFDFICADLSFISLEKVFDVLWALLKVGGKIVCLVKPQFEADVALMRKCKGILRDEEKRKATLDSIMRYVESHFPDAVRIGFMESPIRGGDGNLEYLLGFVKRG